ncbi:transcription factor Tfb4-domain-containing protein [Roridomyces roridus]|uniref:General transcription and DNA repair factor IIH subunit TFB4 n=1 Tax=Roridomyces roridus TaxID=1738132 RepID=A0AAD7CFA4_9AGAR|nr:transcription factor Tfb4-domain-containing protein [Roridomyces roridus]
MDDSSKASHLSVVLDLSPSHWELSAQESPENAYPLTLATFLSQLLAFLNAHIACRHENTLAVFGAFPGKSIMLYSSDTALDSVATDANPNAYPPFAAVDSAVVQHIMKELDSLEDEEAPSALVGAIAKALCYVNRITLPPNTNSKAQANGFHPGVLPDPRILVLSVSPDLSTSYIPIMNAIFSAQKLKATIDVCQIYGPNTVFLQQAAHLTGGSYIFLERRDALLQYLIMSKVDFRAACFCHKKIVDIGFVCSVCLSSETKFPMKTLQRLNAARPLLATANSGQRAANASRVASSSSSGPVANNGVGALPSNGNGNTSNGAR